jgi:hypothetical protein
MAAADGGVYERQAQTKESSSAHRGFVRKRLVFSSHQTYASHAAGRGSYKNL